MLSPSLSRITKRIRSSITELSFHGIPSSALLGPKSVTHVSGTFCYLCLRPDTGSLPPLRIFGAGTPASGIRWFIGSVSKKTIERWLIAAGDGAFELGARFVPGLLRHKASQSASGQIVGLEVDAAVAAGHAGLVGGIGKRRPGKRHRHGRHKAAFDQRRSWL